jgi:hypothetical protein
MDDSEKVEQARALYDEGVFNRKIIERKPLDLFTDRGRLECGHVADVPRTGSYERWQCSECLKPYRPASAQPWYLRPWIFALPLCLFLLWIYVYTIPILIESGRKEAREKQQVLDRIEKLEQRIKQLESRK